MNGTVRAVELGQGVAYIGGDFTTATGTNGTFPRAGVAAFNLKDGSVTPLRADADAPVRALALSGSSLYVGGDFTSIGGQQRNRLAQIDPSSGTVSADFTVRVDWKVWALATSGDRLYLAGGFNTVAGVPRQKAAAIDLTNNTLVQSFDPQLNDRARAIAVSDDGQRVFIGGYFTEVGSTAHNYLAEVDREGDVKPPAYTLFNDWPVMSLALANGGQDVFAGVAGSGNRVLAFRAGSASPRWQATTEGDIQAISHHKGNVYFGFHQGRTGDKTSRLLAADAQTGKIERSFRPVIDSFWGVRAIDADDQGLVIGGEFTTVNQIPAGRVAFFDPTEGTATEVPPATGPGGGASGTKPGGGASGTKPGGGASGTKPGGGSTAPVKQSSVKAKPVKRGDALRARVKPKLTDKQWRVVVQRKNVASAKNSWRKVGVYRTTGPKHTKTINLGKGKYRVRVPKQRGYASSVSTLVRIKR